MTNRGEGGMAAHKESHMKEKESVGNRHRALDLALAQIEKQFGRSEERRVGKECRL